MGFMGQILLAINNEFDLLALKLIIYPTLSLLKLYLAYTCLTTFPNVYIG